jgi:dipeptidyl aminopeptidase/acylaminoacyl peptidase
MDFQICPKCEALNPPTVKRCEQCKAELPEVPEFAPPPAPPAPEPEPEPEPEPAGERPFEAAPPVLAKIQQLEAGIEAKPNANALYLQLCQIYVEGDRKDLAIQTLERCLEHDPKNVYIRHRLDQLTGAVAPTAPAAPPAPAPGAPASAGAPGVSAPRPPGRRPQTSAVHPVVRPARPTPRRPRRRAPSRGVLLAGALGLVVLAVGVKLLLFPGPRCVVTGGFSATGPVWSPTGQQFAFLMQQGERAQLGLYDPDKGEHRALAEILGYDAGAYDWSPDGSRIAYVSTGSDSWEESVYVVDVASGQTRHLANGSAPSWSSDGSSILMWCGGSGVVYDDTLGTVGLGTRAGPCRVNVADGSVSRGGYLPDDVHLGWGAAVSPLLGRIAFERVEVGEALASGGTSLDGEFVEMVDSVAARGATNIAEGSRDLARELEARQYMERRRREGGQGTPGLASDVFVVDFLGGPPRQLTTDGRSRAPTWTADGTRIVYTSGDELWMMDAEGGDRQPLVRSPLRVTAYTTVALTPDGDSVLFVAPVEGNEGMAQLMTGETPADLHIAPVGGTTARRLSNRHSFKQRFALSPDGKRIVYEVIAETGTLTDSRTRSELWMMFR